MAKEIVALVAQAGSDKATPVQTTSGVQLAAASQTNKDMKEQLQKDKSNQLAITNKTINVNQTKIKYNIKLSACSICFTRCHWTHAIITSDNFHS